MDTLDTLILRELGFQPFTGWAHRPRGLKASDVAKSLGKNVRLVQDRITRMEKEGVIAGYALFPNPRLCGLRLTTLQFTTGKVSDDETLARLDLADGFVSVVPYVGPGLCLTISHATPQERSRRMQMMADLVGSTGPHQPLYDHVLPEVDRELDRLDWRIIAALAPDARRSVNEVAEEVGVTVKTVRTRLGRMREEGSIDEIAIPDLGRMTGFLGFELAIWHTGEGAKVERGLLARLRDHYLAHFRAPPDGYCPLLFRLFAGSPAEMQSLVRAAADVEGVVRTETLIAAGVHVNHGWLRELLQTQLRAPATRVP